MTDRLFLGRFRLTSKIALLVIASVGLSVVTVSAAISYNLATSTRVQAMHQQSTNLKAAATILVGSAGGYLPGIQLTWTEDGEIDRLSTLSMPQKFLNHDLVDSIARITGSDVSVLGRSVSSESYERISTTLEAEGGRIVGSLIDEAGAAHDPVVAGQTFIGEDLVEGRSFYSGYLPIVDQAGSAVGFLAVGSDKAAVETVVYDTMRLNLWVGIVVMGVLGVSGYLISRAMMSPIPKLAQVMDLISEGDYDANVPFSRQGDEIGDMARAVDVFRENGRKVGEMTEAERAASVQRRAERADMMAALQVAFGEVVDAAVAGDFTKRV